MDIFTHKPFHWILKLSFEERRNIFRIAIKLRLRPSVFLSMIIQDGLTRYKAKYL